MWRHILEPLHVLELSPGAALAFRLHHLVCRTDLVSEHCCLFFRAAANLNAFLTVV